MRFFIRPSLLIPLALAAALALGGCGLLPESGDETIGWSAQKLYGEAKDYQNSRDWAKAIKLLEKIEARYPYGRFAQQAQIEVAYCYWKDNDRTSALAAADRFIKLYPNHPNVDYMYYLKGLVNFNEDRGLLASLGDSDFTDRDPKATKEAFDSLKDLVTRYPQSKYADDATARMRYLVNALAQYEVHVARYYMKRGAYIAAANRAQTAVQHYSQAPATEEAVFIMVKAYDAMGMNDLRDASDRVMKTNFPNSKYLRPGGARRDVPWWKLWDPDW